MSVVLICIFLVTGKTEYPFLCFLDWCVSPSVHCLANPLPILKIEFPVFFLLIYSSGMFEVWLCPWLCTDFSQTIISLLTLFLGHSMELKSLDGQIPWFFFFFLAFIILKILFKSSCPSQAYKAFLLLFFPSDSFYPMSLPPDLWDSESLISKLPGIMNLSYQCSLSLYLLSLNES